ncbi:2-succinyl-5-enolpyruvyl-6-hydroxy-3-cyclohexene-1-carboxylic-acid synthase [Halobacterium bonnevillei]|uniref:2-succinyl-5-enolpyruvyl-6-hydroxy-3-cyclohexene-1-carboxylate synthase n=1 Tax=Halobacterium bonnevillei TaxID=2692200 RepID=A0A6B0SSD8_9EURY|nr:2-succinyl-5-enolpyruvyl-6-hydroxy-3-cyclohexene-1-carboxylic-acid synthase [Halobacterium bonnevillei]MXR21710.1 2-succinyl-5-enolpyruvyl-6-hydroxy-3-cyclohexene-1-carboxylic-acid synthase [Halobacterium bonnevillei]
MTAPDRAAPNRNTLWARAAVDELAKSGVDAVCVCPGSRSTPLTVAFAAHDDIRVFSHLDERSAAFFALGRGKRTGTPTPVVSTSGTATANFHPAVIEANQARVPLLVLTADRPPELRDSGANQTIDQQKLYGDAVRHYRDLPEPAADDRKLRSLRTAVCRAVGESTGANPGPAHLNFPFRKPLEPVAVPGDVPEGFADEHPLAATGREDAFVSVHHAPAAPDDDTLNALADAIDGTDRGLIVAGPDDAAGLTRTAAVALAEATGFPLFADPLSDLRYGTHVETAPVVGGYDGLLAAGPLDGDLQAPDVVLRFGASPTSKPLRQYLRDSGARQFVVDPAGEWREATFTTSDLVVADPTKTARALAGRLEPRERTAWTDRVLALDADYWDAVDEFTPEAILEGDVVAAAAADAPDPATLFVSNSMPVRDLDRFGRPRDADITVLGNRGASGIDGITSSALGAGSATDEPLVLVTGDLAYYHDSNGLLALDRCEVDATVVLVNNDGGGIFHMLPIEAFDPPFTGQFKTPHGLDFEPTGDVYDLEFARVETLDGFRAAYRESVDAAGTQVIEVETDAAASHRERERLEEWVASDR